MTLPAFAARWALGEVADELLLSSARVNPGKLLEAGYEYPSSRAGDSTTPYAGQSGSGWVTTVNREADVHWRRATESKLRPRVSVLLSMA